jgi:hypothetical protein
MLDELAAGDNLGDDLLDSVGAIARFLYGRDDKAARRRVTALTIEVPVAERIPSCVIGGHRCSRKSWIIEWIAERREQELAAATAAEQAKARVKVLPVSKRRLTGRAE